MGLKYYANINYTRVSDLLRQASIKTDNQWMAFSDSGWQDCPCTDVATNYIFNLIRRCYGRKQDILDYWGTILYCLLSYYILSKDKGL